MATYVVLTRLRPAASKTLDENPARLDEIRSQVQALGGKITAQYATLGEYDFVTVVEAPGNAEIARIGAEIGGLGTMRLQTFPAIEMGRFTKSLKIAPYRTEPHAWQTRLWARAVRRAGRYWTTTRYVRAVLSAAYGRGPRAPARVQGRSDRHREPQLTLRLARGIQCAAVSHPQPAGDGGGGR